MVEITIDYEFFKQHLDMAVFVVLGLMSLIMFWKVIERYWFFSTINLERYQNVHDLDIDLESGLTPIFSIGANAPFVGLLGTVIGILITFYDIGVGGGDIDSAQIMIGLALALKATALGILVAIPAMIFYNALSRKVIVRRLQWLSLQKGSGVQNEKI